jgi:hypothetical protein
MNIKRAVNKRIALTCLITITVVFLIAANMLATTAASFTDLETGTGNSFQAWSASLWTQTTQADFEAGVTTQVDTSSSPGSVILGVKSDWYNANWQYRRVITIDHTKVQDVANPSTTYANFPVLVYATGLSNIKANGADIRFTSSDGITELPREIERYSSGSLYAWVKVTLTKDASDSSNDVIYVYYGNAAANEPAPGSTYGSQNVWDSNFRLVSHMKDDPDTSHIADSTANRNNGTKKGAAEPAVTSGKIGDAQNFDGVNDLVSCGNNTSLNIADNITIGAWIFINNYGSSYPRIVSKEATTSAESFALLLWTSSHLLEFLINTGSESAIKSTGAIAQGVWVYVTVTFSRPNGIIYINGVPNNTGAVDKSIPITANNLTIGNNNQNVRPFNGIIDEVRVSATVRSADWIKTEYNNQSSPSAFCSVGGEEGLYVSPGTIASQVLDSGVIGADWNGLFWDETLESNTDITFELRASDTSFNAGDANPPWNDVGGTSPIISGLPSGRYMQWRAVLTTSDEFNTPTLSEVRVYYF